MSIPTVQSRSHFVSERVEHFNMTPTLKSYYPQKMTIMDRISSFCSQYLTPSSLVYSPKKPIEIGGFNPALAQVGQEVVVFGDIHGELFGFIENLLSADLLNNKGDWNQKPITLVQLGDVIDRGFGSEAAWEYLALLQTQAASSVGAVIRLIGNHELMLLEGYYGQAMRVIQDPQSFAERVKQDILDKKVKLAHTDGKRLFLHAGMRTEIRNQLVTEIMEQKKCSSQEIYVEDIVDYLNRLLIEAVAKDDFSHPIFNVGVSRGGQNPIGGVLWEDMSELANSKRALDIPQVIGHNPPRNRFEHPIRITESQKLIEVDAGLNAIYGGQRAYVVFNSIDIKVRVKDKEEGCWMEWVAKDYLNPSYKTLGSPKIDESPISLLPDQPL